MLRTRLSQDAFFARELDETLGQQDFCGDVLGAFYLKLNFSERCSHICNAGLIVKPALPGHRIGRLMGKAMVEIAASLGCAAVMFNLVFETHYTLH